MARVLRAIGNQTYVIVPVLVPAKIHPLDLLRLLARILATGMGCRKYGPDEVRIQQMFHCQAIAVNISF